MTLLDTNTFTTDDVVETRQRERKVLKSVGHKVYTKAILKVVGMGNYGKLGLWGHFYMH